MKLLLPILATMIFSTLVSGPVFAQENGNLADAWTMQVKSGMSDKFEAAFKKHLALRIKRGDTRVWEVYQPTIGASLNHYVVRSCCVTWGDLDTYEAWVGSTGLQDHWTKTADKYVESYTHQIDTIDFNNSNWQESAKAPALVSVTSYLLKPGSESQWSLAMAAMSKHAREGDWPYNWAWGEALGGAGERWLAVPHDTYASMEPSDRTFAMFLSKQMDSKASAMELLSEFSGAVQQTNHTIYRFRPDMSSPHGE